MPKTILPSRFQRKDNQKAFSLVEVTLAIGIVAFAFVAILGMIPVGLSTFRSAMETSVVSQIYQQVVSDLQQTSFSDLSEISASNPNRTVRYFDEQGISRGNSSQTPSAEDKAKVLYTVNTVAHIPSTTTEGESSNLATITIEVVKNPGNVPLEIDSTTGRVLAAQGIYISRYFTYAASQNL